MLRPDFDKAQKLQTVVAANHVHPVVGVRELRGAGEGILDALRFRRQLSDLVDRLVHARACGASEGGGWRGGARWGGVW